MSIFRKIETVANLATILVAIIIATVVVKAYVWPSPVARSTASLFALDVAKGKRVDGRGMEVDWGKNRHTLVLAISTTCHFCKESIPFYKKLGAEEKKIKLVAVLPQSVNESQKYLNAEGVHVDEVRQVSLNNLGVKGTPTLLLVDDSGVVTDVWVGKLQAEQELQVLNALKKIVGG